MPSGLRISTNARHSCPFSRDSPDEGVDLGSLNVVQLLHSVLDVALVGTEVNNEDKGVVVLNLLHGRLGGERVLDGAELVHPGKVRDRLAGVLGSTRKTKGVGAVERHRSANLLGRVGLGALEGSLLSGLGLGLLGSWDGQPRPTSRQCAPRVVRVRIKQSPSTFEPHHSTSPPPNHPQILLRTSHTPLLCAHNSSGTPLGYAQTA